LINLTTVFRKSKFIIGMIHLPSLPGTANGKTSKFSELRNYALNELNTLQTGGVDAVIVENFWDLPYYPDRVDTITVAAMASLAGVIVEHASIPVGINVLYNDFRAELAIARAVNAAFIRAEVFIDPAISETGLIPASCASMVRERSALNGDEIAILADVHGKNTQVMWKREIVESAMDAETRGLADAIIVTGAGTGKSASLEDLESVKQKIRIPLLAGSGVNPSTLKQILNICDGVIVGSYFKEGGNIRSKTDVDRVRDLTRLIS